jgi:hypothetical protein
MRHLDLSPVNIFDPDPANYSQSHTFHTIVTGLKVLLSQEFNSKNDQANNKNKYADPVDAMHITYPLAFRSPGVFFPEIKVLGNLSPHAHKKNLTV